MTLKAATAGPPADPPACGTPPSILVLGLTQRVGTNYLARLLHTHPDCTMPTTLHEDFLVSGLPHLNSFLHTVASGWKESWGARAKQPQLRSLLGAALADSSGTTQEIPASARCCGRRPSRAWSTRPTSSRTATSWC